MTEPLLNPQTRLQLQHYLAQPTHSLILSGSDGCGKQFIASWLADSLDLPLQLVTAEDAKSSISIDQIRQLYQLTRTGRPVMVLVDQADQLSLEAQNAFLKLLEEPPTGTKFILTTVSQQALLSTIRSRSQAIRIAAVSAQQLRSLAARSHLPETDLNRLLHLSRGRAGIFSAAINDEASRGALISAVDQAKLFYSSQPFDRHCQLQQQKFDRQWARQLIDMLVQIIESLLSSQSVDPHRIQRLTEQAALLEQTAHRLFSVPGNPKIHLTKLAAQL